jgi:hypothetical protein
MCCILDQCRSRRHPFAETMPKLRSRRLSESKAPGSASLLLDKETGKQSESGRWGNHHPDSKAISVIESLNGTATTGKMAHE